VEGNSWYTAENKCVGYGGHLATIGSSEQNEWVRGLDVPGHDAVFYMGIFSAQDNRKGLTFSHMFFRSS